MLISVGHVYSEIQACTPREYAAFRECLTFVVPNAHFSKSYQQGVWDGKTRFFRSRSFPTGLLHVVLEAIPSAVVRRSRHTAQYIVDPCILKTKKMQGKYAYQCETVQKSFEVRRGIWHCATGSGKTIMAAAFFQTLQRPSLFIVHTKDLMKQAVGVFEKETTLPIGTFGSGVDDRKLITVGMIQTLSKKLKEEKAWFASLGCVFVDECHLGSAKTFMETLKACSQAKYRFGISGTPLDRSELDNLKLMSFLGPVFAEVRNAELGNTGVSAIPEVQMIELEHPPYYYRDYFEVYEKYIVKNDERNALIVATACKFLTDRHRVLVLVSRIDHGFELQRLLERQGITVAFCSGQSPKEERESEIEAIKTGDSQVLILSRIGEVGLDIPELSAMIRASGGKSTISTLQAIGRLLRNPWGDGRTVKYVDIFDKDDGYLEKHSLQRKADYEREGFEVRCGSVEGSL